MANDWFKELWEKAIDDILERSKDEPDPEEKEDEEV